MIRRFTDWLAQVLFPGNREQPAPTPVEEFLNPYQPSADERAAGERFRDWYLDERVTALAAEMEAAATTSPHTRPLINSQAGLQAHLGGAR